MKSQVPTPWMVAAGCSLLGLLLGFMPSGSPLAAERHFALRQAVQDLAATEGMLQGAGTQLPASSAPPASPSPAQEEAKPAPLSLEERGDIYMARKSYADAVEYYIRALKKTGSTNAGLWNKLGIAYQQQVRFRPARKAYNAAIRYRKDFPEPWNNLGTVYYLQNKYHKSMKYYQQAIRLNPTSAAFHLNLGTSYYHLKKIKEAVEEYRRALELDPNCLTERSSMGTVVQARGGDVEFYFYLAKVFASLDRTEEAVRYLRRAFEDGFQDRKRIDEDPDFLKISHEPSYVELMKNPPLAIKD